MVEVYERSVLNLHIVGRKDECTRSTVWTVDCRFRIRKLQRSVKSQRLLIRKTVDTIGNY